MRLSSSHSLQLLAASATDATMSSRGTFRGGRSQWRRGFSDRPVGGSDQLVNGDSHFRSVQDANLGFRPVERGNYANHSGFHHRPFNPNQPVGPRPPFNRNQPPRFHPRPPKPLDYRDWEYARPGPPYQCERFIVLSYNILADYLAFNHRSRLYFHIPRHILDWEWRKRNIIFELGLWSADIMCFQEVDQFHDLEEELKFRGYSGIWKMRTGNPIDGCAVFWRASRFKLLHEECIEFNKLGLRDNVAQICVLESLSQNETKNTSAFPTSSTGSNKVVICNIHVLYNPGRGEIKLGQVRVLLDRAHSVSKIWDDAPVVICGDFNCTPKSPLYNFISEQKLDFSGVDRDKVSGQASAEIRPPNPYSPNPRAQFADNSIQATTMVDDREVAIKQSDSLSDMRKQTNPDSNLENMRFINNSSQPRCINTMLDVSDKSCIDGQCRNENSALSDEGEKETQQDVVDGYKGETLSTVCVPVDSLKESPNGSHNEGGLPVDQMKDGIHEYTPTVASCHEDIHSDVIETRHGEKVNNTSHSSHRSFSEYSQSIIYTEYESMNCDKDTVSLVGEDYSTKVGMEPEPVNTFNSAISSSELLCRTSSPDAVEVSPLGSSGNLSSQSIANEEKGSPSTQYQVNIAYASTGIDFVVDEKLENVSLDEPDEATKEDGNLDEDYNTFLSELHNSEDTFPSDLGQFVRSDLAVPHNPQLHSTSDEVRDDFSPSMDSEPVDVEKTAYDPSLWTPMEIETATGNADCTFLEHSLKLRSTYTEVEDCSGTRDSNGEPLVTSYHRCFLGTVDYIWRSEGLQTVRVRAPIPKQAMQWTPGFPTKKWGSDHIALVSELVFTKDVTFHTTKVQ